VALAGRETRRPDLGNEGRERMHVGELTRSAALRTFDERVRHYEALHRGEVERR
jgi:hypothetical protein